MWNSKPIFQKAKGFTLIEVLLAISLSTLIMIPLYNILSFSTMAFNKGNEKDDLLLNGRYAIEYIKKEIKDADMILSSNQVVGLNNRYKDNLGFVIMKNETALDNRFISYHVKDGKLIRLSGLCPINATPTYLILKGFNEVCDYADTLKETVLDPDNNIIRLVLNLKMDSGEDLKLNTDIYIRCPLKY